MDLKELGFKLTEIGLELIRGCEAEAINKRTPPKRQEYSGTSDLRGAEVRKMRLMKGASLAEVTRLANIGAGSLGWWERNNKFIPENKAKEIIEVLKAYEGSK
jgi:hypothetical protein